MKAKSFSKLALSAALLASCLAGAPVSAKAPTDNGLVKYSPEDNFTDVWSRAEALKVQRDSTNTIPVINRSNEPETSDKVFLGDAWPLTNLHGDVVKVNGWHILFSLTNSKDFPRHHPDAWAHS